MAWTFRVCTVTVGGVAILLIGFGSSAFIGDQCPSESTLPVWMIIGGAFLFVMTVLTISLLCWRETLIKNKKTLLSIGWAFCFGLIVLIGYLTWLAMWLSLSYYSIVTIKSIREVNSHFSDKKTCEVSTVVVALISVILVWAIGIGLSIKIVINVLRNGALPQDNINDEEGDYEGEERIDVDGGRVSAQNLHLYVKVPRQDVS